MREAGPAEIAALDQPVAVNGPEQADHRTIAAPALLLSSAPGRWVVAVTVLGSGIASLDATVVNIALPAMGAIFTLALRRAVGDDGYTLTLAAFLLIGGSLGDRAATIDPGRSGIVRLSPQT